MQKSLWTVGLVIVALIGCGGEPEESTPPPESAPESTPEAKSVQPDPVEELEAEPFQIAVATQDEIEAAENGERLSDVQADDEEAAPPAEDITSTGESTSTPTRYKFLTVEEGKENTIPGFEWVDEDAAKKKETEQKAKEEAEMQAGIEAAESEAAMRAEMAELKAAQEKAEQERLAAEAAAEKARMQAEADALARKQAQEELERIKAETEKQRMAAEAEAEKARAQADAEALAKKEAQEELVRVQAEAEAALIQAREEQKMAEAEAAAAANAEAGAETSAPATPAIDPVGTIKLAKLDLEAQQNATHGVGLSSAAKIEHLNGAKIELAAYFYDTEGNPLKDTDKINRSSRGQVYVGKESIVPSDDYDLTDTLFIPFDQLELAAGEEHEVQVELVLWEYSKGRGQRLAVAPKATFRHAPASAAPQPVQAAGPADVSGTWKYEDSTITIVRQGDTVALNGLGMVPYNIVSEQWSYDNGVLTGTVVNKRNFPPLSRVWNFTLTLSPDGNALTGTFHREGEKGNFAFDSEPFTWTRIN